MEILTPLIPAFLAVCLLRLFFAPIRLGARLAVHALSGYVCLWLINSTALFTGILIPINAVTVLTAGVLGLPGMGLLALLTLL